MSGPAIPTTHTPPLGEPRQSGGFSAARFAIPGPVLLAAKRIGDARGFFLETYSAPAFAALGIDDLFLQDNHSLSARKYTVRGIHFQTPPRAQAKLVRVIAGAILDIAVDLRRSSPTYGRHVAATLSAENAHLLYVPAGFGHAFCTLEPATEVTYKVTGLYAPEYDRNLLWNDETLALPWPTGADAVVISEKDRAAPRFSDFESCFP